LKLNLKSNTTVINLYDFDAEDIGDVLLKIEKSFDINLTDDDLKGVKTFGSLCDLVVNKVKQHHSDSCTTQQAFYKLRNVINSKNPVDKCLLKPQTKLSEIFPRDNRIEVVADIEAEMGFHMNLLQPKQWIIWAFGLLLLASVAITFYTETAGYISGGIAIFGLVLAGKFGKELKVKTLGDLSEKIAREHYLKCRRDASTVNRAEVNQKIKELFADYLDVEPSALTKEARFA
jgi:acyl carrier protein